MYESKDCLLKVRIVYGLSLCYESKDCLWPSHFVYESKDGRLTLLCLPSHVSLCV